MSGSPRGETYSSPGPGPRKMAKPIQTVTEPSSPTYTPAPPPNTLVPPTDTPVPPTNTQFRERHQTTLCPVFRLPLSIAHRLSSLV